MNAINPERRPISPKFPLGRTVATRAIALTMQESEAFASFIADSLARHAYGQWGDLDQEDKDANDRDLVSGGHILSCYTIPALVGVDHRDGKVWIETTSDRSSTCVMFPSER